MITWNKELTETFRAEVEAGEAYAQVAYDFSEWALIRCVTFEQMFLDELAETNFTFLVRMSLKRERLFGWEDKEKHI